MTRKLRHNLIGIPQYITQFGINRNACFFDKDDYEYYLASLAEAAARSHCQIHAYSLLPNNIHILITSVHEQGISRCMQSLNRRYVQYINTKHNRIGTLWAGRYNSCLVDEALLLDCYRYIELTPVHAKLVKHPSEYHWSSYNTHTNGAKTYFLNKHAEYLQLGTSDEQRKEIYFNSFNINGKEEANKQIRNAIRYGHIIGSDEFKKILEKKLSKSLTQRKRGRPKKAE